MRARLNLFAIVLALMPIIASLAQQPESSGAGSATVSPTSSPERREEISGSPVSPEPPPLKSSDNQDIVPGRLILKVDPRYPKQARKKHIQGTVVLRATIEKDGTISSLSIEDGDLELAEAAVDVVLHQWRYEPYTRNGAAVKAEQLLTFGFSPDKPVAELEPQASATAQLSTPGTAHNEPANGEVVYRPAIGKGIIPPHATYTPDPQYDDRARKNRYQGVAVLSLVVGIDGHPLHIKVVRALGEGLDIKAVEAVNNWRFDPGTMDGKPVATIIVVEVQFRLY